LAWPRIFRVTESGEKAGVLQRMLLLSKAFIIRQYFQLGFWMLDKLKQLQVESIDESQ